MRSPLLRYGISVLTVMVALLLKLLLDPLFSGTQAPFILFFTSVIVSARYGGLKAGLLATVLSALAGDYFFVPPKPSLLTNGLEGNLQLSFFLVEGLVINFFAKALQGNKLQTPEKAENNSAELSELDISTAKQIESALRDANQRLNFYVENSPLAVIEWDSNFRVSRWSREAEALFGWQADEVIGKHPSEWQFVFPEDAEAVGDVINQLFDGSQQRNISKNRNYQKNGSIVCSEWYNSALLDEAGNLVSVLSLVLNITARQQVEEELRKSEQGYRDLANAMPLIVSTTKPDGAFNYYNQRWFDYTGMTLEQSQGWGWQSVVHPNDIQQCLNSWNAAIRDGQPCEIECRIKRVDNTYRWHLGQIVPMQNQDGEIISWVATWTDIDDRKQAEEKEHFLTAVSEELSRSLDYQTTLTNVANLVVPQIADWCAVDMIDENQNIYRLVVVHVNPLKVEWARELHERYPSKIDEPYGISKVLRIGKSELYSDIPNSLLVAIAQDDEHLAMLREVGCTSAMIVPLITRGQILGAITLVSAESGRHYDASDLSFAEELARSASLAVDNGSLLKAVQQELTNRIQTEAELRESERRFRTMADSAPMLLWVSDTEALCNFFNQSWLAFRGRTLEQELGNGWIEGVHQEDLQRTVDTYMAAFDARENFEMEYRLLRADGEYRWILDRGTPRFMPDGSFAGYIGSCLDITERILAEQALRDRASELAHLSAILAETNTALEKRNQELDQFAYVVSHDLKAPLRAIANLSTWIEEDLQSKLENGTRQQMDLLRGRVHRMEALIDGLLQYSRVGRTKKSESFVDVAELLAEVIDMLDPPPEFTITVEEPMPVFNTERLHLEQVFTNLIGNAIKHHNRLDGNVTVSVEDKGDFYEFAIADDGIGIAPQYHDKVFVIFQTLEARDKVENTGVGLAIVKKIIENKGGTIHLESQVGQGAAFYFSLPK